MPVIEKKPQKPTKKSVYQVRETDHGTWKIHFDGRGKRFREFRSHAELFDLPLIHLVSGINPETQKRGTAHGIVAIGNNAKGFVAIGQFCQGYFSFGQFASARILSIGQFAIAPLAIGQMSLAVFGLGQIGFSLSGIYQLGATVAGGIGQVIFSVF